MTAEPGARGKDNGRALPRISVVTAGRNAAAYLEETIRSVLDQGYPNLEYVVIDAASTDESVDIIRRYADRLHYWVSEPDKGFGDGLNKGFAHTTGEIMAWINADDKYLPWAFQVVGEIFAEHPEIQWLTSSAILTWNQHGLPSGVISVPGFSRRLFFSGRYSVGHPANKGPTIQQESTFWRRSLWERAGGYVRTEYGLDFELWSRFWQHAVLWTVNVPLGGFRYHPQSNSSTDFDYHIKYQSGVLARYPHEPRWSWLEVLVRKRLSAFFPHQIGIHRFIGAPMHTVYYDLETARWTTRVLYDV